MDMQQGLKIEPTIKLKQVDGQCLQCFRVDASTNGRLSIKCGDYNTSVDVKEGNQELMLPEAAENRILDITFKDMVFSITQQPVRRLRVHIIQSSHHDYGYTDLPPAVAEQHAGFLKETLQYAKNTEKYPYDSRFRIVIEQFWSLEIFWERADNAQKGRMLALLRNGQFEVNALYGNMITEICGHEPMLAALEPAFAFAGEHGVPIACAEHNDISGFSWGLARALCDAGVKYLCVGFPQYHCWGDMKLPPYWNDGELIGRPVPGGFWWEAPDGKRVLLWTDHGYGYSNNGALPELEEKIENMLEGGYPYSIVRYPVSGAAMDNAPYITGFCDTVRRWNEQWDYPRLIMSTNHDFFEDIGRELKDLPVYRGEVPCQDYPMGSLSLSSSTALNMRSHNALTSAEALSAMAQGLAKKSVADDLLDKARRGILAYDEHCFGFHFPCGPAQVASKAYWEFAAAQTTAWIHAAAQRAMAEIADRIPLGGGHTLVVFNPTQKAMTALLEAPLREYDNSGQYLCMTDGGWLKPAQAAGRWHVSPQGGYLNGEFRIINDEGNAIPFQIDEIKSYDEPEPYAGERLGLGSGTRRYGFFEMPQGLAKTLRFVAENVPPCGWKAYRLIPCETKKGPNRIDTGSVIQNNYYTISYDNGGISIRENETGRELLDNSRYSFGEIIVRDGDDIVTPKPRWKLEQCELGPVRSSLTLSTRALGHPRVIMRLSLAEGLRRFDADFLIEKDGTPLLTTAVAFPFATHKAHFSLDGTLSTISPGENNLSGSYCDVLAAHGWLRQTDADGHTIVCSSLDGCLFSLSEFRNIYISPAHRCVSVPEKMQHPAPGPGDFSSGGFYSLIDCNNFGTNFSASNSAQWMMRYRFTTKPAEPDDAWCDGFARSVQQGPQCIFKHTERSTQLILQSLYELDGDEVSVIYLRNCGVKYRMALWNRNGTSALSSLRWYGQSIVSAHRTDAVNRKLETMKCSDNEIRFIIGVDEIFYCEWETGI